MLRHSSYFSVVADARSCVTALSPISLSAPRPRPPGQQHYSSHFQCFRGGGRVVAPEFIRAEQAATPLTPCKNVRGTGVPLRCPTHGPYLDSSWSVMKMKAWDQKSNENMSRYAILMGVS